MAVKETYTTGSLSVGGNLAAGGELKVSGSTTIGHNLKVEGWLDAKNVKGSNKGIFTSAEALAAEYPNPENGWFAGVGTSIPCSLYIAWGGQWVRQDGGQMTVNVDSTIDAQKLQALQNDVNQLTNMLIDLNDNALRIKIISESAVSPVPAGTVTNESPSSGSTPSVNIPDNIGQLTI